MQAGRTSAATVISTIRSLASKSKAFKSILDNTCSEREMLESSTSDGITITFPDDSTDTEDSNPLPHRIAPIPLQDQACWLLAANPTNTAVSTSCYAKLAPPWLVGNAAWPAGGPTSTQRTACQATPHPDHTRPSSFLEDPSGHPPLSESAIPPRPPISPSVPRRPASSRPAARLPVGLHVARTRKCRPPTDLRVGPLRVQRTPRERRLHHRYTVTQLEAVMTRTHRAPNGQGQTRRLRSKSAFLIMAACQ
jgi:hypothetical protein